MDDTVDLALSGRFLRGLAKSADRPALLAGGVSLTYQELHERALLLAGSLLAHLPSRPAAIGVLAGKGPRPTRRCWPACTQGSPWSRCSRPSPPPAPGR